MNWKIIERNDGHPVLCTGYPVGNWFRTLISIAYQKYPCPSATIGMSYGKYVNLRNNPASPINARKTNGFFVEFSNVLTIFNFVDNLKQHFSCVFQFFSLTTLTNEYNRIPVINKTTAISVAPAPINVKFVFRLPTSV